MGLIRFSALDDHSVPVGQIGEKTFVRRFPVILISRGPVPEINCSSDDLRPQIFRKPRTAAYRPELGLDYSSGAFGAAVLCLGVWCRRLKPDTLAPEMLPDSLKLVIGLEDLNLDLVLAF
jgi:hypothetical protein